MTDFDTPMTNTWCPGCGNFPILKSVKEVFGELTQNSYRKQDFAISTGIGCHAKIFDYLDVSGFYSIHGRVPATSTGIKLANPDLEVIGFAGDGDAYNEGISHLVHAARRNIDITMVIHDNKVYALTTGQFTPTSPKGFKGKSSPEGSVEEPLNPMEFMISCKASFVARGFSGREEHLEDLLKKAIKHNGFALIDVLQPCVAFYDTWDYYSERVYDLQEENHDASSKREAREKAKIKNDEIPIGIFYKERDRESFEESILDKKPVDESKRNIEPVIEELK